MQRQAAIRDIVAGLSVAGLLLPEAVAYAAIAGLSPARAIAGGVAGCLAYAALGRSRFAIVSPTSASAAILAAAIATLPGSASDNATALVLCVGAIFLLLALFRLGSLASFVSRPVLRGFAFGLALTIIVKQLPRLTGLATGPGEVWQVLAALAARLAQINPAALAVGLGALAALVLLRRVPRVPATLLVIGAGIALSLGADLAGHHVAMVGTVALAPPRLALPSDPQVWARLLQLAAPLTLIVFAESWGTMRSLALRTGDTLSPSRELGAVGAANLAAGLVQGMPVGAGFSAGSANAAAGATSRLAAAAAGVGVLLLAVFATRWIALIPEPVLAAVVIAALLHALSPAPLLRLVRLRRDYAFALAAAAGVLLFGVLNGLLAAVALSVANLLYDLSHPTVSELGQVGTGHDFVDLTRHPEAARLPGLAIFRPNAPLMFANSESVLGTIAVRALASEAATVILSMEESDDLDTTALDALGEFATTLHRRGKRLILARVHDRARAMLSGGGLTALADSATFSVADAAAQARGD